MSNDIKALIDYRLSKADEAFEMAQSAIEKKYWNSVASSLYYTCFYLITALFAKHNIQTHTHTGVRAVFGSKFIKEGNVDPKWGKFLTVLFNKRQVGDYGDFAYLTEEEILPVNRSGRIQSNDYEISLKGFFKTLFFLRFRFSV